jgi:hypothetical protein
LSPHHAGLVWIQYACLVFGYAITDYAILADGGGSDRLVTFVVASAAVTVFLGILFAFVRTRSGEDACKEKPYDHLRDPAYKKAVVMEKKADRQMVAAEWAGVRESLRTAVHTELPMLLRLRREQEQSAAFLKKVIDDLGRVTGTEPLRSALTEDLSKALRRRDAAAGRIDRTKAALSQLYEIATSSPEVERSEAVESATRLLGELRRDNAAALAEAHEPRRTGRQAR